MKLTWTLIIENNQLLGKMCYLRNNMQYLFLCFLCQLIVSKKFSFANYSAHYSILTTILKTDKCSTIAVIQCFLFSLQSYFLVFVLEFMTHSLYQRYLKFKLCLYTRDMSILLY